MRQFERNRVVTKIKQAKFLSEIEQLARKYPELITDKDIMNYHYLRTRQIINKQGAL